MLDVIIYSGIMRIVVGMSGGVDSSVAALLLKQAGHEVIGLFMNNWKETTPNGVCTAEADFADVQRVCSAIDIPYYSVNYSDEYMDKVFSYFIDELKRGRTPNPDVICNREIKFKPFAAQALKLGANYIATGHYADIKRENGVSYLLKAVDNSKDQTYFLNQLSQQQLNITMFPLAKLNKSQVREIAKKHNISTADKKDSTGICFIGERNYRKFLQDYLPHQPGDIYDINGKKVGKHIGLMYYTIGQRRGLNLGGTADNIQGRWFVADKLLDSNRLIVSHNDESILYSNSCISTQFNWIPSPPSEKFTCTAKFRYRQPEQQVCVELEGDKVKVNFAQAQRAVTTGQFVVLYSGQYVLGGGIIDEVIK